MTTSGEGGTPTALDLLFGPNTDAAEILAGGSCRPAARVSPAPWRSSPRRRGRPPCRRRRPPGPAGLAEGRPGRRARTRLARAPRYRLRRAEDAGRTRQHRTGQRVRARNHAGAAALRQRAGGWQTVATLQFGLSIVFDLNAVLLEISGGQLTDVRSGRCDVTATLAVQGADLFVRQAHLEPPVSSRWGGESGSCPHGEYPAGAGQPESPDDDPARQLAPEWDDSVQVGVRASRPPGTDFDDDDDEDDEEENHRRGQAG